MAWTTPRTWVTGEAVSASDLNRQVRNNLNALRWVRAKVDTSETTASTTFTDLTTVGPRVAVTFGNNVDVDSAIVVMSCELENNTAAAYSSVQVEISGANTRATDDASAENELLLKHGGASTGQELDTCVVVFLEGNMQAGKTVFTMKYSVTTGTGTFSRRTLAVGLLGAFS